jgi:hypothetical protein
MATASLDELLQAATDSDEPRVTGELNISPGGVDPLGLRQINFQLMDQVFPGLNNVARHIRPYAVIAWAWRRAAFSARSSGNRKIELSALQDFVDRIEVLYVWSQLLNDPASELPGREFLARLTREETFTFGGAHWKKMKEQRRYSTALSAPVNYGPAVKTLGWIVPSPLYPGAFVSSDRVGKALDGLERALGKHISHQVFNQLGSVEITKHHATEIGEAWALLKPSPEEQSAMEASLTVAAHKEALDKATRCIKEVATFDGSSEASRISVELSGPPSKFVPSLAVAEVGTKWRLVQMRQLFRLALEGLLHWVVLNLAERPLQTENLIDRFLEQTGPADSVAAWIDTKLFGVMSIPERISQIQYALDDPEKLTDLAKAIRQGLAISLSENYEETPAHSNDRLPLSRASKEAMGLADQTVREFLRHVFGAWVFGQHVYWAVGRGLGDARNRGKTILRLKVVQEEGGWTLAPGTNSRAVPRATPDRLETAVSLMKEAALFT